MPLYGPVVVGCVNCFVIVCNMSQKVFRDCLGLKRIIWDVKGMFGQFLAPIKGLLSCCCGHPICHIFP